MVHPFYVRPWWVFLFPISIFSGLVSDLGAQPDPWTVEGQSTTAFLGWAVAGGDYDGDSHSDVLAGAPGQTGGQQHEGFAFLFLGAANGPATPAAWSAEGNLSAASFGEVVALAGDTNGDGVSEVLVGAPEMHSRDFSFAGKVSLFSGNVGAPPGAVPSWEFIGANDGERVGKSVAGAGDVNGDGFADVIVGAPFASHGEENEGWVAVFYGSLTGLPAIPDFFYEANLAGAQLGFSVDGIGDVNGDGFDDVAIGSPEYGPDRQGRIFVFHGSRSGLSATPNWNAAAPLWLPPFPVPGSFSEAISGAGDVNGDGFADLIVGAPYHGATEVTEGAAVLYLGSPFGLQPDPAWLAAPHNFTLELGGHFGYSVSRAGDYNGDGYDDVLIGAPWHAREFVAQGAAFLFLGSASGLSRFPARTFVGEQSSSRFGYDVAGAGDVNGDGYDDVLMGAPEFANGPSREGKVYLHFGEPIRPIFFDGFESGTIAEWSTVSPE